MLKLLKMAAGAALPTNGNDFRRFWLGCVGVRKDGTIVMSKNGASHFEHRVQSHSLIPTSHAEGRVLRKIDAGATLYVSRVSRKTGQLAMAMPCPMCQIRIKAMHVKKVYYSINSSQYGVWNPKKDTHKVFNTTEDSERYMK